MTREVQLMGSPDSGLIAQTLNHWAAAPRIPWLPSARPFVAHLIKDCCCGWMIDGENNQNASTHTKQSKANALQDDGKWEILPDFRREPWEQLLYDS